MSKKLQKKISRLVGIAEQLEPDQVDLLIAVAMEMLPNSDDSDNSSDGENKIRRKISPSPRRAKTKSSNSVSSASEESVSEPEGRKEPMEQVMRGVEQGEHPIALDAIGTDEKEVDAADGYGHEPIGQPLPIVLDELHELEASADECEAFLPATT